MRLFTFAPPKPADPALASPPTETTVKTSAHIYYSLSLPLTDAGASSPRGPHGGTGPLLLGSEFIVAVVQWLGHIRFFATPWTAARLASLSFIISWSLLKLMSVESVMPSDHLILYRPFLLLPSIFLSIRVFSNESALHITWLKYWSFCLSISPCNEYSELIFFRIDWFDSLLSVSLVAQSCPTLCNPMDCSTPGFPVLHQLPELAHTHVHRVGNAIQPSHPLSSPSSPAFNLSQHQDLYQ